MVLAKKLTVINLSLLLIVILLILHLFGVQITPVGLAAVDTNQALCIINWQDEYSQTNDFDRCCLEAKKQLSCRRNTEITPEGNVDWVCKTGENDDLRILLNNPAYKYCINQAYW
jgi:hypothetical protein